MASGTEVGKIYYSLDLDDSALQKGLQKSDDSVQTFGKGFADSALKIAGALGITSIAMGAVSKVTDSISGAIKRVDTLNNSSRTFANMGFTANDTKAAMDSLDKSIRGLPTSLNDAVSNVELLAGATSDVKKSQQIFSALNDGVLGFGGTAADVSNITVQLSQALAGGRIDAMTWNSMLQSGLGPTLTAMAKSMGITMAALKTGLSDGSISVQTFEDSLVNLDKNGGGGMASLQKIAKDSTSGIGTGFANMQTAITRGIADIIQTVGAANISAVITNIGKAAEIGLKAFAGFITTMTGVFQFLARNKGTLEQIGIVLGILLTPAIITFGVSAAIALGSYVAGLAVALAETTLAGIEMAASWLLALGPIGLIIAVVAAAVALIIMNWDTVKQWLSDFWSWLQSVGVGALNILKDAWGGITSFFSNLWQGIKTGAGVIFDIITSPFRLSFNAIAGFWNNTVGKLSFHAPDWVPGIGGKGFSMPKLPMLAKGGFLNAGQAAIVGERGAELFVPRTSGTVVPNNKLGGASGNMTTYIYGDITLSTPEASDAFFAKLNRKTQLSQQGLTA